MVAEVQEQRKNIKITYHYTVVNREWPGVLCASDSGYSMIIMMGESRVDCLARRDAGTQGRIRTSPKMRRTYRAHAALRTTAHHTQPINIHATPWGGAQWEYPPPQTNYCKELHTIQCQQNSRLLERHCR